MSRSKASSGSRGGHFRQEVERFVERFSASVAYDQRLYPQDILGSLAHAASLQRAGVLSAAEHRRLCTALEKLRQRMDSGAFPWSEALEDVHMNLEAALIEEVGELGKKLHTGRSRNDQVALDMRLYLRGEIDALVARIGTLQGVLVDIAEREAETVMPGLTHLQPAQPVSFGHHMLAWFEMLQRDCERLVDCRRRLNRSPLGAAALAGNSFVDPRWAAQQLEFDGVCENSLDAVSDRDFVVEFCAAGALLMCHLSRWAEELILWSSPCYGFISLPDRFCTGSSIMPQKKNPDVAELVRGKSGRVYGNLIALLTLLKAQALAYNRDNQEDKERLFDTVDTLHACLEAYGSMLPAMELHPQRLGSALRHGFPTATDLADYLVRKGVPFRDAHHLVGRIVGHAQESGRTLEELSLEELRGFHEAIEEEVFALLSPAGSMAARDHVGGTAPAQVRAAAQRARARIQGG